VDIDKWLVRLSDESKPMSDEEFTQFLRAWERAAPEMARNIERLRDRCAELETLIKADQPKRSTPAKAAPTKCTVQQINKLIERTRSGQPPELPEGKREEHYHDPALRGLYIRVLRTGVATWTLQYKSLRRQKKIKLGSNLVLDRQEAIKAAKELLAKVTLDTLDPHKAKRERMRADKVTFATLVPLFLEHKIRHGELRPRTVKLWNSHLTKYHFQPLHRLPIDEITKDQLQTRIDDIAIRSGSPTAEISSTIMRVFFKWALKTGKLPDDHRNPMDKVQAPKKAGPRERVLNNDEIQLIWKTCDTWIAKSIQDRDIKLSTGKAPHSGRPALPDSARVAQLLFLTGCRSSEISNRKWSEVDLDHAEMRIPGQRTKNAVELCNPLSKLTVEILHSHERRPDRDCVFGHTKWPGQNMASVKNEIDRRISESNNIPPKSWILHDIRRTFRTRMAALKVSADVAEALLGHVGHRGPMERTYNRYKYWAEKRNAIGKWETHLRAVIDGTAEKIAYPRFREPKKGDTA
jgi:integrase